MEKALVAEKVIKILAEKLNLTPDKISPNARLREDLGMDSFGSVEIAFELEEAFSIKIPDADIVKVVVVQDVIDYIETHSK